ncbi:MAG: CRISPR-associated RAMP protein [Candidatus Methanoperedenaceae archaeon]|nr:CRISPR-associated RAMP protein [Candidatus Methanoperedenaceae archaeon]
MYRTFENRAIIQYTVNTISSLHIGGHGTTAPAEMDHQVIKNSSGFPIIPGSSLKGVFRTELERLIKGLGIDTCTVPDVCKSKKKKDVETECPVCLLFGGGELAGSVRIKDATARRQKTTVRDGVAIERKTRKAKDRAKYDIEVVPKGTEFGGEIVIENLNLSGHENAKLGGFLGLVEFFNACSGSIGHATSRGFGQVSINIDNFRILTADDYLNSNYDGKVYASGDAGFGEMKDEAIKNWGIFLKSLRKNPATGI